MNKFSDQEGLFLIAEAVLLRAINDYLTRDVLIDDETGENIKDEVSEWFFVEDETTLEDDDYFSFDYICKLLNLDKVKVRFLLNAYFDQGKEQLRESGFNLFLEIASR